MFFKNKYVKQKFLARVYIEACTIDKVNSSYYGVVGTKTDLTDIDGKPLYVGDIVTGIRDYRNYVCYDSGDHTFFLMGLKSGNNISAWHIKKEQDHGDLKIGDKIGAMYVIEGKTVETFNKQEVLKAIDNIKDLNSKDNRNYLKRLVDNLRE